MGASAEQISQKAKEIGFSKVGFAKPQVLADERVSFAEWLENGFHAEMKWMEREPEKRTDPALIFPEVRSIVAVALNYYTPHRHENSESKGKVSRYAWGDDYHDVMQEKLRMLLAWIKAEFPGAEGKICCDIQPFSDKAWAERAGLGWVGKHSNLITKEYGSWVFLGEILLNMELEPQSSPETDHCGKCTACIDACPTNAIIKPYLVDSNRCLSYATIESRSPRLTNSIIQGMDGWLYGCDICQDVCPWNRFQKSTNETRFEPRKDNVSIPLDEVIRLSPDEYARRFRGSAMKRAKLGGLQRNARALQKNYSENYEED